MSYPRLTHQRICSDFIYTTSHVKGFLSKGLISWIRKYCVESKQQSQAERKPANHEGTRRLFTRPGTVPGLFLNPVNGIK